MKPISDKYLDILRIVLPFFAFGSLLFLAIGLKDLDNYLDAFLFGFAMVVPGFVFGSLLYILLSFFIPYTKSNKKSKRSGFFAPLTFAFSLIFFGVGTLINESSDRHIECKDYIIQDLGESGSRNRAYFVFVNTGKKIERMEFGKDFNKKHQVGDTLNLCIKTGLLGFKYYKLNSNH